MCKKNQRRCYSFVLLDDWAYQPMTIDIGWSRNFHKTYPPSKLRRPHPKFQWVGWRRNFDQTCSPSTWRSPQSNFQWVGWRRKMQTYPPSTQRRPHSNFRWVGWRRKMQTFRTSTLRSPHPNFQCLGWSRHFDKICYPSKLRRPHSNLQWTPTVGGKRFLRTCCSSTLRRPHPKIRCVQLPIHIPIHNNHSLGRHYPYLWQLKYPNIPWGAHRANHHPNNFLPPVQKVYSHVLPGDHHIKCQWVRLERYSERRMELLSVRNQTGHYSSFSEAISEWLIGLTGVALGQADGVWDSLEVVLGQEDGASLLLDLLPFPAFVILGVRASSCLTLFPPLKGTATRSATPSFSCSLRRMGRKPSSSSMCLLQGKQDP